MDENVKEEGEISEEDESSECFRHGQGIHVHAMHGRQAQRHSTVNKLPDATLHPVIPSADHLGRDSTQLPDKSRSKSRKRRKKKKSDDKIADNISNSYNAESDKRKVENASKVVASEFVIINDSMTTNIRSDAEQKRSHDTGRPLNNVKGTSSKSRRKCILLSAVYWFIPHLLFPYTFVISCSDI